MGAAQCKEAFVSFTDELEATNKLAHQRQKGEMPWYADVEVDEEGCRVFKPLPPVGEHPRLLFTREDIPGLAARHTHTYLKTVLKKTGDRNKSKLVEYYEDFMQLDEDERANPGRETLDKYFVKDFARNEAMLTSYIDAFVSHDEELMNKVKSVLLFYANILVKSCEMARAEGVKDKPYDIWHNTHYDMTTGFLFGGAAYALVYDLMYDILADDERALVRKSISLATSGRRAWGMGWPSRRIQSNWAPYHGDLMVMCAAIEGEEGFDKEVYDLFETLMVHYLDYSIYDSGHPIEDAYVPNLAFREGSIAFMVMARRGFNLFRHPHYINLWRKWMPYALEPHNSGKVYGGSSGSNFEYPTAAYIVKYMYPRDPVIDYVYRHYLCEDGKSYDRMKKAQCAGACAIFALPAHNEEMTPGEDEDLHDASDLGLPTTFRCNNRGKTIMRSDWKQSALWFTFDARSDGFLIGHDTASRGAFVLNSNGRSWGMCPEWRDFRESTDYSLVAIDGIGQKAKAPYVRPLDSTDGPLNSTYASADLTYAYNWEWTQWVKEGVDMAPQGWEPEPHSPREFGMTTWWLPNKIFGETNIGFDGLHQWRRRFNTVEYVTRSAMMVRGKSKPFVIVCDDVKQDDEEREYSWSMTTPTDVSLVSFNGTDAVLGETGGDRRLVVRVLSAADGDVSCEFAPFSKPDLKRKNPDGTYVQLHCARLKFTVKATEAHFRIAFFGLASADEDMPRTSWNDDKSKLTVSPVDSTEAPVEINFGTGDHKETTMAIAEAVRDMSGLV